MTEEETGFPPLTTKGLTESLTCRSCSLRLSLSRIALYRLLLAISSSGMTSSGVEPPIQLIKIVMTHLYPPLA